MMIDRLGTTRPRDTVPQIVKLTIIAALLGILVLLALRGPQLSFGILKLREQQLIADYLHTPLLVVAIFFGASVAVTAISLPGAVVLTTTTAGIVFGFEAGTVIASFTLAIGSSLAFLCSRYVLNEWVRISFGRQMAGFGHPLRDDIGTYLLSLRLIPVIPYFLVNVAMGLTSIRLPRFYILTQLGMLPCVMLYVNAGRQIGTMESPADVLSTRVMVALILLGMLPVVANLFAGSIKRQRV